MSRNVEQGIVIDNLNKYLRWHNMPVRMHDDGICNGLVSVYAKYALENREQEFLGMLDYIVGKKPSSEMEDTLNQFIYEVVSSLFIDRFDKKLCQSNSMQTLTINNKPLKSAFDFAMTGSDKNWEEIIKSIELQNNEVMRISSTNHTAAVTKKNNEYIVYDPNYSSGIKKFADEKELISELHYNVFGYHNGLYFKGGSLGLMINVMHHPENKEKREFPKICAIYDKYLTRENINNSAIPLFGVPFNTLEQAAVLNDAEVIKQLIAKGAVDKEYQASINAVVNNNPQVFSALLLNNRDTAAFQQLFLAALEYGREEIFDQLFKMKGALPLSSKTAIRSAAKGGNPLLLTKVIRYYMDSHAGLYGLTEAISTAIESGSVQCVQLLIKQLNKANLVLDIEKNMDYLLESIRKNQPHMVALFIKKIPLEYLKTITMSALSIERTDLFILQQLQYSGVIFSDISKAVIAQKEHRPVDFLLAIGIKLHKFTDFCAEVLLSKTGVSYKVPKGMEMRGRFFETKKSQTASDNIAGSQDTLVF